MYRGNPTQNLAAAAAKGPTTSLQKDQSSRSNAKGSSNLDTRGINPASGVPKNQQARRRGRCSAITQVVMNNGAGGDDGEREGVPSCCHQEPSRARLLKHALFFARDKRCMQPSAERGENTESAECLETKSVHSSYVNDNGPTALVDGYGDHAAAPEIIIVRFRRYTATRPPLSPSSCYVGSSTHRRYNLTAPVGASALPSGAGLGWAGEAFRARGYW